MQKSKKYKAKFIGTVAGVFFPALAMAQTATGGWDKSKLDVTGLPHKSTINQIITNIAQWLLMIFGIIAVIGFVISGIMYLISAGDEDMQERAKRAMVYSITGVIVGLAGLVVIYAVDAIYNGQTQF